MGSFRRKLAVRMLRNPEVGHELSRDSVTSIRRFKYLPHFSLCVLIFPLSTWAVVMTSSSVLCLLIAVYMSTFPSHSHETSKAATDDRLAVLKNRQAPVVDSVFAFHTNEGKLRYKQRSKGKWSDW